MRRIVLEDPFARSAIWSRNLAIFAFFVAAIGILLSRKGLDPQLALSIVGAALGLAGLAVLFALLAMAVIWHTGFRGIGLALGGLVLSALLFAYPAFLAVEARTAPVLSDITTDLDDPPAFLTTEAAQVERHGATPPQAPSEREKAIQRQAYPDLQPLVLDADLSDISDAVHKLIKRRHWTLIDELDSDRGGQRIDVAAASLVMGFPLDIAIRIKPIGNKVQVDMRAVARKGWQEQPRANVQRLENFLSDVEDAVDQS